MGTDRVPPLNLTESELSLIWLLIEDAGTGGFEDPDLDQLREKVRRLRLSVRARRGE